MENILDRSKSYLSIFTKSFEIDKSLPKWKLIIPESERKKTTSYLNNLGDSEDIDLDEISDVITFNELTNLNNRDFNVYIGKRIQSNIVNNWENSIFVNEFEQSLVKRNYDESLPKIIRYFLKLYRKFFNQDNKEKQKQKQEQEIFEYDIIKFFSKIKGLAKENQKKYVERIEPYMIALKQANDMGQQALADKLSAEIINNKFESILFAANLCYKITEKQIVDFVKKTENGVQLCYVKNFIRPIPIEIIEKKKEVDKLLVFDNYCVMYYDNGTKSFTEQTEKEKEEERKKKADPILFGMINGTHNLYYIADWVDEYCDLTLEEFLKVSGIDKQHISINEKIKL